ncbi:flavin reductase family protein [Clostridium cellulovorans]|uniref:Flavin reductase domain protein FMN-binding n=1 Tax=Clostridium cellulovorans (strain ATCC 35296 / DSM 3052 / OCM 3 / 743B) TaxID=573061 RepID=D9SN22_CLOC7|nr:flavin reductase family protein [Clostridium cellulovorans]ADL51888.1 flavin reductase domain protein FMN-binding [Clostridium cellulovorans 743B]
MAKKVFKGSAMLNPVPSVLITSKDADDKVNVFTVGWIGIACTHPPMISVAIRPERLSYENIKDTKQFVVNLPTKDMVKIVDYCGVRSGRKIDKIKHFNLELEEGISIAVPSLKKAPVALECEVKNIIPLGSHDLFLAEIKTAKVEEDLIDDNGKIHFEKANLISYSHGEYYGLNSKAIGSFGFSVTKKAKRKEKK